MFSPKVFLVSCFDILHDTIRIDRTETVPEAACDLLALNRRGIEDHSGTRQSSTTARLPTAPPRQIGISILYLLVCNLVDTTELLAFTRTPFSCGPSQIGASRGRGPHRCCSSPGEGLGVIVCPRHQSDPRGRVEHRRSRSPDIVGSGERSCRLGVRHTTAWFELDIRIVTERGARGCWRIHARPQNVSRSSVRPGTLPSLTP